MTLYARSDITAIAIGGVGHTHVRPSRRDGTPVRTWELDCADCETHLDDDILWSKSKYKIPLTEEEKAENAELAEQANAAIERERIAAARALAEGVRTERRDPIEDEDDKPVTSDRPDQKTESEEKPPPAVTPDYEKINYNDLVKLAKERGVEHTGKKPELIKRLEEYDDQPAE